MRRLNRQYLKEFVLKQKCIPSFVIDRWEGSNMLLQWRNSAARVKLYEFRARLFNINTAEYWNEVWSKEIRNIPEFRFYKTKSDTIVSLVPEGAKVLDVGCGIGILMERLLKEKKCDVFGIDISERAIGHLKTRGMDGIVKRIPPIPVSDNSFDVVIATSFLEHCNKPVIIINEMLRVLRMGGAFIVTVPENLGPDTEREHIIKYTENSFKVCIKKYIKDAAFIRINEWQGAHLLALGKKMF